MWLFHFSHNIFKCINFPYIKSAVLTNQTTLINSDVGMKEGEAKYEVF